MLSDLEPFYAIIRDMRNAANLLNEDASFSKIRYTHHETNRKHAWILMPAQLSRKYIRTRPWKIWSRLLSYTFYEGRPLTTRGQWINPLVFAHFALAKRLPQLRKVVQPIYIVGTGRSGTTLLGVLLSMHRDAGFLNEPKALWHSVYPNEDIIGSYSQIPGKYRLRERDANAKIIRSAHRLYAEYLTTTFSRRVVDKYQEMIFRVPFVKAIFPDAKFLFLVRNGWDAVQSIASWSDSHGTEHQGATQDWWGENDRKWNTLVEEIAAHDPDWKDHLDLLRNLDSQIDRAVVEWILTMQEGLKQQTKHPDDFLMIRYETLCAEPEKTFGEISVFCDLEPDPVFMKYACDTVSRPPVKEPFAIREEWRELFLQTMSDLGYDESGRIR